jgi:hypothetical protein
MRSKTPFVVLTALLVAFLVFPAATAAAQYRHGPVRVHVGVGWGYPAWGWGYPYWGLGWGWGWGGYWGPWGYPYAGYYGPRDDSAEVKLEVKPKDAQVFVNGYYAGLVDDFDGTFQRLHLAPGDHELVLFLEGYRTVKQSIRVRPREDAKIRYTLEPLPAGEKAEPPPPPPPEEEQPQQQAPAPRRPAPSAQPAPSIRAEARGFGTLVFRVQPVGAEILIDGERWQGPEGDERLVVQVSEGSHRVEIRKEGFVPYTGEVTVRGGGTTPLNVSLPAAK